MANGALVFRVIPPRMLNKREAAEYCKIPQNRLSTDCSVTPIEMPNGSKAYDVRDLDDWIDQLKGGDTSTHDAILDRLG